MEIIYSKQAVKAINAMASPMKLRIKSALEKLPDGDTKQIKSRSVTTWRLRVGGWRILYFFGEDGTLHIEKISPRGDFYKGV